MWTTTLPTEPGYYWADYGSLYKEADRYAVVKLEFDDTGAPSAYLPGVETEYPALAIEQWGPRLTPPVRQG